MNKAHYRLWGSADWPDEDFPRLIVEYECLLVRGLGLRYLFVRETSVRKLGDLDSVVIAFIHQFFSADLLLTSFLPK